MFYSKKRIRNTYTADHIQGKGRRGWRGAEQRLISEIF